MLMKLNRRRNHSEEAFTLIEVLVVVIIIGILAAVALPLYFQHQIEALKATVKTDVRNSSTFVVDYLIQNPTASDIRAGATAEDADTGGTGFISATVSLAGAVGFKESAHGLADGGGMTLNPSEGNTIEVFGGWQEWRIYGTNEGVENWVYAYFSNPHHIDVVEWSGGEQWVERESFPELDGASAGPIPEGWDVGWCAENPVAVAALTSFLEASLQQRFLSNLTSAYSDGDANSAALAQIEREAILELIRERMGVSSTEAAEMLDMLNSGVMPEDMTDEDLNVIAGGIDARKAEKTADYEANKVVMQDANNAWTAEAQAPLVDGMKAAYAASGSTLENGVVMLDSNLIQDPAVQAKIREYSTKFYDMPSATMADIDAAVADIMASAPSLCGGPLSGIVY